jgi:hypothetical protein
MFLSADPIAVDSANRYAYVVNNPMRLVDPSGLCFTFYETEFDCSTDDFEYWLHCALACSGVWGDIARWGFGKAEFWANVGRH